MKKNITFKQIGLVAAIVAATAFAVQPAIADSLTYNGQYYSSSDSVTIHNASPYINEGALSGAFSMKDNTGSWTMGSVTTPQGQSFKAWCIDIYDRLATTTNYTLYGPTSFPSVSDGTLTPTKITQLERLASNDLSLVNNATTSSAFQLAAWEIMAETGPTLNVNNGSFSVTGGSSVAQSQANTWLGSLGSAAPTMQLYVWVQNTPGSTQDLAVFAPVPEPETYAMLLAGLGLIGFIAYRRKNDSSDMFIAA